MLLGKNERLVERIVHSLAAYPGVNAELLHHHITSTWKKYSIQAIYQELRKLERDGVVVRKNSLYSLRFLWLVELGEFANRGYETFLRSNALLQESPEEGEKKRWVLYDLHKLLDLWTDLSFVLLRSLPKADRTLFEYVPHVWFHTANPVNEEHFIKAIKREQARYVLVSSGKTALDRSYEPILKQLNATFSFGRQGFPAKEHQHLSVIGDYVIDVKLSPPLLRLISNIYENKQTDSSSEFSALFTTRTRCVLELTRNSARAKRERSKFVNFFGTIV